MIIEQNMTLGLEIAGKTSEPSWDGKPADYDHIMFVLGQHLPAPDGRKLKGDSNHSTRLSVDHSGRH